MAKTPNTHSRHARHRQFGRVRRSGKLLAWLDRIVTALAGTATAKTFTADHTTGILSSTAHGFKDGAGPMVLSNSGGALPAGLSSTTLYFVDKIDADTFYLTLDRYDAGEDKERVAFTGNGTGTQSIKRALTREAIFKQLETESAAQIEAATDIDQLN